MREKVVFPSYSSAIFPSPPLHDFRFGYVTKVEACMCGNFHVAGMSDSVRPMALLSMGFFRQEYWSGVAIPSPRDLPDPGNKPVSLTSLALAGGFLPLVPPGKPLYQA